MEFCEKLKELRNAKSISQAKLAADIHISRSAVAKWENGLGLPNDESLKMLADYFGVTVDELISNKQNEEILVSKNKTIDQQKKVILGFTLGCAIGLFILAFIFIEPLRGMLELFGIGAMLIALGIFNMCGNIASIHWYNRRKVTKENQKVYCFIVGLGTNAHRWSGTDCSRNHSSPYRHGRKRIRHGWFNVSGNWIDLIRAIQIQQRTLLNGNTLAPRSEGFLYVSYQISIRVYSFEP